MKIGLISLGCPKNLVDSEVMLGLAQQAGHELTRDAADADVLVVNTCAFIDKARQESIDTILEMAEQKKTGRCTTLIVTGCMGERYRDELRSQIPEIDAVLGTGDVPEIVTVLAARAGANGSGLAGSDHLRQGSGRSRPEPASAAWRFATANRPGGPPKLHAEAENPAHLQLLRSNGEAIPLSSLRPASPQSSSGPASPQSSWGPASAGPDRQPGSLPTYLYDADTPRLLATPRHYAYVKIAEGCDYKCAFCIIPKLRGNYRSRPADSIVREAERLAAGGVKELLLISQDTTFYGIDRGERGALAGLLRRLNRVDGLEWIRLLYLYPTTIGDDVLDAIAESEKVCRYIDLPLQHASDAVLQRMKRPGTRASYERLLDRIRTRLPGVTLRTTFIVGFPGETEADFQALQDFVKTVEFDHVGVFTYSHEEDTSAFALADDVPARVKRERQRRLMAQQKRIVVRAQKRRVGRQVRLVVDGPASEHELVLRARASGQAPDIDPIYYLTECDPSTLEPGQFIDAEIVGSRGYDLLARPMA